MMLYHSFRNPHLMSVKGMLVRGRCTLSVDLCTSYYLSVIIGDNLSSMRTRFSSVTCTIHGALLLRYSGTVSVTIFHQLESGSLFIIMTYPIVATNLFYSGMDGVGWPRQLIMQKTRVRVQLGYSQLSLSDISDIWA